MSPKFFSFKLYLAFFLLLLVLNCEKDLSPIQSLESYPWLESSPGEQGFNGELLSEAFDAARQKSFVYSFLVIRNGYLVGEEYFNGFSRSSSCNIRSISKSFISALVGIALQQGYLDSLEQKMLNFFPEYDRSELDPRTRQITVRHLLMMRAGFDNSIEDYGLNWMQWINSPDWVRYAIRLPIEYDPGTHFAYITAESHLLSAILTKVTGMSTLAFARKHLFDPLQISIVNWERDPKGYYIGGTDMYFTSRDLARFGYLYLNGGEIDGKQIVPPEWVEESLTYWSGGSTVWGAMNHIGYGYQWWLGEVAQEQVIMALGYGGQFILIFPNRQMIVVATSYSELDPDTADDHEREILAIVANYVLPSLVGAKVKNLSRNFSY